MLELQDASLGFSTRNPILQGVCAQLLPQRGVALLGPNGAGKSLLLSGLAGLHPHKAGRLALDGQPWGAIPAARRAARLAYLPQKGTMPPGFSVREAVAMGQVMAASRPVHAMDSVLADLGLAGLAEREAAMLSGGEQQKVRLARCLVQLASGGPGGFLLLDEPEAGLDPGQSKTLFTVLRRQVDAGYGVLVSVHDPHLVPDFADEVWFLRDGRLTVAGPPEVALGGAGFVGLYR